MKTLKRLLLLLIFAWAGYSAAKGLYATSLFAHSQKNSIARISLQASADSFKSQARPRTLTSNSSSKTIQSSHGRFKKWLGDYAAQLSPIDPHPQVTAQTLQKRALALTSSEQQTLENTVLSPTAPQGERELAIYLLYQDRSHCLPELFNIARSNYDMTGTPANSNKSQIENDLSLKISALRAIEKASRKQSGARHLIRIISQTAKTSTIRKLAMLMLADHSRRGFTHGYLKRLLAESFH